MDGIEQQYPELRVERFNIGDAAGAEVYRQVNASGVPTTILRDATGAEVYRTERKLPRPAQVREVLAGLGIEAL